MNKTRLLVLAFATLLCPLFLIAGPNAAHGDTTKSVNPASARDDVIQQVRSCEAILREFQGNSATAIPARVLGAARAIIITNQFKVGFVFGIQGGYGVILVKHPDGKWSVPAVLRAGEASLGLQLGGKSVEMVYVITDDQTPRQLLNGRLDFGADAKAVAGPKSADSETWQNGSMLKIPVLVYSKDSGLYAGATVKAGFVARDDDSNHLLYNTAYNLPELLYGNFLHLTREKDLDVLYLMNYVTQIAH